MLHNLFFCVIIQELNFKTQLCQSGGMVDASDSKSDEGNFMRVRVPPLVPKNLRQKSEIFFIL